MTRPKGRADVGQSCWKVRIVVGPAIIHVLSKTEPVWRQPYGASARRLDMDPINGTDHGDTIGFIDWSAVSAVTWRESQ